MKESACFKVGVLCSKRFSLIMEHIGPLDPSTNVSFQLVGNVRNKDWLQQKVGEKMRMENK